MHAHETNDLYLLLKLIFKREGHFATLTIEINSRGRVEHVDQDQAKCHKEDNPRRHNVLRRRNYFDLFCANN